MTDAHARAVRFAVDTGGTFTDLVVEDEAGNLGLYKSPTTPDDPVRGVLDVLQVAADARGEEREAMLGGAELFIHATTHPINAILTGRTARTAFLTTAGHPDVLLFREGGRTRPFDATREYPPPYIPRRLTFEVPERVAADGEVVTPLDEARVREILDALADGEVEAIAVCLLWSIANPEHERRVGELIEERLPSIPYTLSHVLNPAMREYRRGVSAAIDASLKPQMRAYLAGLTGRLGEAGFDGRVLMVTSTGGVLDVEAVAEAPIHALGSGPAMAPVAARHFAARDSEIETAVVADTGGTSYDVSLVRRGQILTTRETWLGQPYFSDLTGFPSVDVKSIGAGGGSIAWVDEGGMLRVGPQSAGAVPGPMAYRRGGTEPTVTDAAVVLGYLDPDYFLGGEMRLDVEAAARGLDERVGGPLGLDTHAAAAAVLKVATEHMVRAIEDITLNQGIDPRRAVLVGGGGAAGINSVAIAQRLSCPQVIMPPVGAVLSAAGALMSDLVSDFRAALVTSTTDFDFAGVQALVGGLVAEAEAFLSGPAGSAIESDVTCYVEARYARQVWELEIALPSAPRTAADVEALAEAFHAAHEEVFAITDRRSPIEFVGWRARARSRLRAADDVTVVRRGEPVAGTTRPAYFEATGLVDATVIQHDELEVGVPLDGPAIVQSPVTTVVVDPGTTVTRTATGSLSILTNAPGLHAAGAPTEEAAA